MRVANVHVALSTGGDRSDLVDLALAVEELGYGGLWLTELVGRDAFSLLTEIGLRTGRIELGAGIVNHYSRSPATLAQAAASLSEVLDGRTFNLGLGSSSRAVIQDFHALSYDRPYARMAEALQLIRMALAGERLELSGEVFQAAGFSLDVSPRGFVRIYVAGLARPMLEVTGQLADGWLPNFPSRQGFASLRADVANAAERAGRPPPTTAAYLHTMVGDDAAELEQPLRRTIAWYIASGGAGYRTLFRRYGYGQLVDDVVAHWTNGRRAEARALISSDLIRDVSIVGPAQSVPEQLARFADIGIDVPVLRFPDGLEPSRQAAVLKQVAAVLSPTPQPPRPR
jgi:probable F420-dependent oxidoreductase